MHKKPQQRIGICLLFIAMQAISGHQMALARSQGQQSGGMCSDDTSVNTIRAMFDAIFACWVPPHDSSAMEVTLSFALRNNGTLIGPPQVVSLHPANATQISKEQLIASAMDAVGQAVPVAFTKSMGSAVAGRVLRLRFIVDE